MNQLVTLIVTITFNHKLIVSAFLPKNDILKDSLMKPEPLILYNQVSINSLSALSLIQSEFELDLFLFQRWNLNSTICDQYRSLHRSIVGENDLVLQDGSETITDISVLSQLWLPQTYMVEVKTVLDTREENNKGFLTIYNQTNGCSVKFTRRLFSKVGCKMDFREYPNDIQNCSLTLTSYFWSDNVLKFVWDSPDLELDSKKIDQNHYEISFSTESRLSPAFDGKNRNWLTIRLIFRRKITHFVYQAVIPSILIISSAYFSFFISVENGPNRFLFTATPFFALITLYSGIKSQLPPVSYINSSDIWMLGTLIFDFSTICIMSCCCYLTKLDQIKKVNIINKSKVNGIEGDNSQPSSPFPGKKPLTSKPTLMRHFSFMVFSVKDETLFSSADNLDNMMKLLFPLLFITFNIVYWILVLSRRLLS